MLERRTMIALLSMLKLTAACPMPAFCLILQRLAPPLVQTFRIGVRR